MSPGVPATGAPLLNLWRGGGAEGVGALLCVTKKSSVPRGPVQIIG